MTAATAAAPAAKLMILTIPTCTGLKGRDAPILARIIGCADAFDAMTSDRAYRPKMDTNKALAELKRNRRKQFDPDIADVFIDLLENRPVLKSYR